MDTDKTRKFSGLVYLCSSVFICGQFFVSGCAPKEPPLTKGYFGETETLAKLVEEINRNNTRLPTLWARHYFEATLLDEKKQTHFVNGEGVLMYQSPGSLRIIGKKDIAGTIFEIGSNPERFWLKVIPEVDTMWWGDYADIDKIESADIPIRPDLMLQVLGIGQIDTDFLKEPAPVLRFNNDADAYMLVWNVKRQDRWIAQREVWYDRAGKLPRNVILFDENGRVVLRAFLSKHQPIESPDGAAAPKVATEYRLFFPVSGAKMSFELRDMKLKKGSAPNPDSFAFPTDPGVSKVIPIHAR